LSRSSSVCRLERTGGGRVQARAGVVVLFAILAADCAPPADRTGPVVRDSAGIRIVENLLPPAGSTRSFAIDPVPLLDIGSADGSASTTFNRIAGIRLRSDGGLIVADEGEGEVRAFDVAGTLRWSAGRRGDGPGEYRTIGGIGIGPADSIWVWDFGLRRFTILDRDGRVARLLGLDAPLSAVGAAGRLADGTFVLQEYWTASSSGPGLHRDPAAIVRFATDASRLDTVALLPGREAFLSVENGRGVMATPLFARRTVVAARGDGIFAGDQERYEIRTYDSAGTLRMLIREAGQDLSISDEAARGLIEEMLVDVPPQERSERRAFLESMDRPPGRPAFGALLVTDSLSLWVADWMQASDRASTWTVFGKDGILRGRVVMPDGLDVLDVRGDRVAGVWRDDLGVEHVRVHRLMSPGAE
jgi:hypothetical protein